MEMEDAEVVVGCKACGDDIILFTRRRFVDAAGSDFSLGLKEWVMAP